MPEHSAVLDTNVLVSALLSPSGVPAKVLRMALRKQIKVCVDSRIMLEYERVLMQDKFRFDPLDVSVLLNRIIQIAIAIVSTPLESGFPHEDDKKFYEVAKSAGAYLVTGNMRHFPKDPCVVSPVGLLEAVRAEIAGL